MSTLIAMSSPVLGPINPEWTIIELVEWLGAEDARQHDASLQHPLALIEAAVTGVPWASPPSTVALIRSLAVAARTCATETVAALLRGESTGAVERQVA
ncbi:hypothetical protein [Microbacterium sp.]|uniref:hypothetical protein n=1 Tax=Microbacterium sp. TaxID=51671 RepID=UPI0039E5BB84